MPNIKGWKMYDPDTDREVMPDSVRADHKGQEWTLHGVTRPPEGGSPGRILASREGGRDGLHAAVFGLEIRPAIVPDGVDELFASISETLGEQLVGNIGRDLAVETIHTLATQCPNGCKHPPAEVIAQAILNGLVETAGPILIMAVEAAVAYGRAYPEETGG